MNRSTCLRCRASLLQYRNQERSRVIHSRLLNTTAASQESTTSSFEDDRFIPRTVKLHGTNIRTPLTPMPEDNRIKIRRIGAQKQKDDDVKMDIGKFIPEDNRIKIRRVGAPQKQKDDVKMDIGNFLARPAWSLRDLLPSNDTPLAQEVTPKQLHHLCRLSALPIPKTAEGEAKILERLHAQLHFLRNVQKVDTEGVEPLRSIRDETKEADAEVGISLETEEIKRALAKEIYTGRNKRPKRKIEQVVDTKGVEDWNVLGAASEKVELAGGKYFVVRSQKRVAVMTEGPVVENTIINEGEMEENLSNTVLPDKVQVEHPV